MQFILNTQYERIDFAAFPASVRLLRSKWKGLDTVVIVTYCGAQFLLGVSGLL